MKILLVQDRLRSGGTERQTILLAKSFQAAGHTVKVMTFRPGGILAPTLAPIEHTSLQHFDFGWDWFAPGLVQAAAGFAPAVVLCMGRMANARAGALKRWSQRERFNVAVVGTMRTGKTLPWLFRRSLDRVDHVVANSNDARQVLVKHYGLSEKKISVIHNALVFPGQPGWGNEVEPERSAFRQQQGAAEETTVLLCVGMLRKEKNQRALLEIASTLPPELDWQLWLVGDGPTRGLLQTLARQLGLEKRVKFFGFQANPAAFYRAADVATLTSLSESLSNFLIEAHAHGRPSVAYDVMGVRECGGRAVPVGDTGRFRQALLELSSDAELRAAEGTRLVAFARAHFSADRQAQAYLDLFSRILPPISDEQLRSAK